MAAQDGQQMDQAAQTIQRNYRGYRTRRQLNGLGLDASSRWVEAVKEAQYLHKVRPQPRREISTASTTRDGQSTFAHDEWKQAKTVALRANDDDDFDTSDAENDAEMTQEQLRDHRLRKTEAKQKRAQNAKMMGLEYFLEMVDQKHRHGSHLRKYHEVWKQADTTENFFYWLDHGQGKSVEVSDCPRERLERDQVRYLSREERMRYLVKVDEDGRLRWAKNDERITTSADYKDSIEGIVPREDPTPMDMEEARHSDTDKESSPSGDSDVSSTSSNKTHHSKRTLHQIPAASLLSHLHHEKSPTWIFVADPSHNLYISLKSRGAFQHSSFLRGSRVAAAGTIRVVRGQLRRLSPRSGHYRPPAAAFRAFVHELRRRGVDMGRGCVPRAYAELGGLEAYAGVKRRVGKATRAVRSERDEPS